MIPSSERSAAEKLKTILLEGKKNLVSHFQIYHKGEDFVPPPPFHFKISNILLNSRKNFAVEAFRESAKTSLVVTDFPTYCLQYPQKDRAYIVIIKQNQKLAEKKLREIATSYLSNPVPCCNLKVVVQQSGNTFECIVTDGIERINVVIEAYGKGAALRGLLHHSRRPNVVIIDDPQDFEDSRSETVLKSDWDWFLSDVKPLGKSTRIFVIGNNLGQLCLIERLFEFSNEFDYETLKIPAIDPFGNSAWPEKFDADFLNNERKSYQAVGKLDIWYRERMCEAISADGAAFRQEMFKYYSDEDCPSNLRIFITVDPAISKKTSADFSCVMAVGVAADNTKFVLEYINKRLDPSELIDAIFWIADKYSPITLIGIETIAYQEALRHFLKIEMKRRNKLYRIEEIKTRVDKETKIRGLVAYYQNDMIYHRRGHCEELEYQLLKFPVGKNDDVIDALAMQQELWSAPLYPQFKPPARGKTLQQLKKEEGVSAR